MHLNRKASKQFLVGLKYAMRAENDNGVGYHCIFCGHKSNEAEPLGGHGEDCPGRLVYGALTGEFDTTIK